MGAYKISVITVTYNCAGTIGRTIDSVLSQRNADYEYIIIDGASTDGTKEIVDKYADKLDYFISEPDRGIYDAMNKGISHTKGDMIIFLNGDDYFYNENVLYEASQFFSDDKTVVIGRVAYGKKKSIQIDMSNISSPYYDIFYPHQATFIPKKLLDDLGMYSTDYKVSADFEWICRAIYNGISLKWIDVMISEFSLGGISSTLQCLIDEYNISNKYMTLTDDKCIDDMRSKAIDKAKTYFFRYVLKDLKYLDKAKGKLLEIGISEGDIIQIWGAGFWADLFVEFFNNCKVSVDYIFDSKPAIQDVLGVKVGVFDGSIAQKIVISTEFYDDQISDELSSQGFIDGINYIRFHKLRDKMLDIFDRCNEDYRLYSESTGLALFQ